MKKILYFLSIFSLNLIGISAIAEIENGLVENLPEGWGPQASMAKGGGAASVRRQTSSSSSVKETADCSRLTGDVEIVILMDGSSSIGSKNFLLMQTFIVNIITALNIGIDGVKVGLTQFSYLPRQEFGLNTYFQPEAMIAAIESMSYMANGETRIGEAMMFALSKEFLLAKSSEYPSKRILILITDGTSLDDVKGPSNFTHSLGIDMFAIGIGQIVDGLQLRDITNRQPNRFFKVDTFVELQKIRDPIVTEICDSIYHSIQRKIFGRRSKISRRPKISGQNVAKISSNSRIDEENPIIFCEQDKIFFVAETKKLYTGRVFVKGQSEISECRFESFLPTSRFIEFPIPMNACGMRRSRNNDSSITMELIVVVSFHPTFITKADRAFHVRCNFREVRRTYKHELDIDTVTPDLLDGSNEMPQCTYSLRVNSPEGQEATFAKVGDKIFHVWECYPSEDTAAETFGMHYGMLVHSCTVDDGRGNAVPLLDSKGCALDPVIMQDLVYDMSPNRMLVYQETNAFKFADWSTDIFNCEITLCSKEAEACNVMTPPQCAYTPVSRQAFGNEIGAPTETHTFGDLRPFYPSSVPPELGELASSASLKVNDNLMESLGKRISGVNSVEIPQLPPPAVTTIQTTTSTTTTTTTAPTTATTTTPTPVPTPETLPPLSSTTLPSPKPFPMPVARHPVRTTTHFQYKEATTAASPRSPSATTIFLNESNWPDILANGPRNEIQVRQPFWHFGQPFAKNDQSLPEFWPTKAPLVTRSTLSSPAKSSEGPKNSFTTFVPYLYVQKRTENSIENENLQEAFRKLIANYTLPLTDKQFSMQVQSKLQMLDFEDVAKADLSRNEKFRVVHETEPQKWNQNIVAFILGIGVTLFSMIGTIFLVLYVHKQCLRNRSSNWSPFWHRKLAKSSTESINSLSLIYA